MKRLNAVLALAIALIAVIGSVANATIYSWTGAVSGDWTDPGNWDGNGVPVDSYPDDAPLTLPWLGTSRIEFNAVGSANPLPTSNIPALGGHWTGGGRATPPIDLKYGGTLDLTLSSFQSSYWNRINITFVTVGDGDTSNGAATLNMAGVERLNRDQGGTQKWTVETDGTLNFTRSGTLKVSDDNSNKHGVFTINGGTITVNGPLENFGTEAGSYALFTAAGGSFTAQFGVDFPDLAAVQAEIGTDLTFRSTATDATLVAIDNGDGTFTVSAKRAPKNISPADGLEINPPFGEGATGNEVLLSWTNIEPNEVGASAFVEVWFGTDPNKAGDNYNMIATVPANGENVESVMVNVPADGTFYWQVDTYFSNDPCLIESPVYSFNAVNDAPATVEIHTVDTMTWSGKPVELSATVADEDMANLVYGWTAVPDGAGDDDLIVDFDSTAVSPTLSVTNTTGSMVTITMILTADDAGNDPVEASVTIDVYSDACDMTKNGLGIPVAKTDINADCVTDIADLAEMAAAWLDDYKATDIAPK